MNYKLWFFLIEIKNDFKMELISCELNGKIMIRLMIRLRNDFCIAQRISDTIWEDYEYIYICIWLKKRIRWIRAWKTFW